MTLLSVVKDVCLAVGVAAPQSVFSGITANRTMQEMLSVANEMAQRIAYNTREWTKLKAAYEMNGDGTTTAFNLPANYKRMLLTSNVWRSTSQQQPMTFIADTEEWLRRRNSNLTANAWGEWTLLGDNIHIYPVLPGPVPADPLATPPIVAVPAATAYFAYLDKNCVTLSSGGYSDAFLNDADSFRLDERLLKLAMIYQWKAYKGSPYAEDMSTYGDALTYAMGADKPSPIIVDRKVHASVSNAYAV
jgi:hypothetical protein